MEGEPLEILRFIVQLSGIGVFAACLGDTVASKKELAIWDVIFCDILTVLSGGVIRDIFLANLLPVSFTAIFM